MSCNQSQDRILDYDRLTASEQQSVEAHLQVCPVCREFARQWQALEGALARQLRQPALSAGFDAQLRRRIASETVAASQTGFCERRRELEAEYAAIRQRQTRLQWMPGLLDVLGYGVAGGFGGWLLVTLLSLVGAAWKASPGLTDQQILWATLVAGVITVLGLAALAFNRPLRQALVH